MISLRFLIYLFVDLLDLGKEVSMYDCIFQKQCKAQGQERIGNDVSNEMNISFDVILGEVLRQLCSLFL